MRSRGSATAAYSAGRSEASSASRFCPRGTATIRPNCTATSWVGSPTRGRCWCDQGWRSAAKSAGAADKSVRARRASAMSALLGFFALHHLFDAVHQAAQDHGLHFVGTASRLHGVGHIFGGGVGGEDDDGDAKGARIALENGDGRATVHY